MDMTFKLHFIAQWQKYFPSAELPVTWFYTDHVNEQTPVPPSGGDFCLIGKLNAVREGQLLVYHAKSSGCMGGRRFTGFSPRLRPNFEYFLSCGIPGQLEGERYKKSPELVAQLQTDHPPFAAPGRNLVFKRWDMLTAEDEPQMAVFFAPPDVLAGLFTLANYDVASTQGVIAPMGSGCATIVSYPLEEMASPQPRCVLGMFDVSARPSLQSGLLTFAVPMRRLAEMVSYMDESFLMTPAWLSVRDRIRNAG
ncbi:MAG TPA: DUF169 domain-containing protein [Anaerolineae bacterium]|jgi:hypothetical protein